MKKSLAAQFELYEDIKKRIRMGRKMEDFIESLSTEYADSLGKDEAKLFIQESIEQYGDYDLIQKIMRSKIIQEASSRKNYILDPTTRSIFEITKERIREILHPKLDVSDKMITCVFSYDPHTLKQLFKDKNNNWVYNQYEPPFWQAEHFFSEGAIPIEKEKNIPKLYDRFLKHLVQNDDLSYNYILDWIANGINERNYCILATIGTVGVGKGRLGDIMREIFGESNYRESGNRIFKGQFNSQVKNKRLLYCDEVSIKDEEQNERLKVLVNNVLEVEAKGKDAEAITNHASIYFSSNSMDAIKLDANDRRFSIVNLTDVPLREVFTPEEIDSLTEKENIDKLARYLYYRPIDKQKMVSPFKSSRTEEVREAGMAMWHDWLLDEYAIANAGKTIKLDKITEEAEEKFGSRYKPYRSAFQRLEKQFPKRLKVWRKTLDGVQVWTVTFPERDK